MMLLASETWTIVSKIVVLFIVGGWSLECHHSEYLHGSLCCPTCPIGKRVKTHCNLTRSTSCTGCEEGTFTDEPNGLLECFPCPNCGPDSNLRVKTACTKTSNSVCEPLEGAYCVDVRDGGCARAQMHSSCSPGQYISERGTKDRDTLCSRCQSGTFSNGTMTSCLPHTDCQSQNLQVVKPGSVDADAVCGDQGSELHSDGYVGIVVVVLLSTVALGGVVAFWLRKKGFCVQMQVPTEEPPMLSC